MGSRVPFIGVAFWDFAVTWYLAYMSWRSIVRRKAIKCLDGFSIGNRDHQDAAEELHTEIRERDKHQLNVARFITNKYYILFGKTTTKHPL